MLGRVGSLWAFHCEADSRWEPREERRSSAHGYITSSIQPLPGSLLRETPSCVTVVKKSANQLSDACKKGNKQVITAKHKELAQTIASTELAAKMEQFDAHHEDSPLFKFTRGYMAMVMEMMTFIRAVQTGDGDLHLEAYSCL